MKCPKCQTENRGGVQFCEHCGAAIELVCPNCGAHIPPDRRFCGECSRPLAEPLSTSAEVAPVSPPPSPTPELTSFAASQYQIKKLLGEDGKKRIRKAVEALRYSISTVQQRQIIIITLLVVGFIFLIAGLTCGPPLNWLTLAVGEDRLPLLLKLESSMVGIILIALSVVLKKTRVELSEIASWATLLIPVLLLLGFGFWRIWVCDDAFITFRAVRNLLSGYGPVYNVGERVEVYTHPLWFGILSVWDMVTGQIEIGAAWLGLLLSAAALFLGQFGVRTLVKKASNHRRLFFIPLGSLVVVALPPFWDYASSGLETGLSFFWLATSFYLLVRQSSSSSRWGMIGTLLWLSLGPLIRPDFIVFSAGFILLSFVIQHPKSKVDYLLFPASALVLPIAYQVFRMGYFASMYPNTALAKSALSSYWDQGFVYLKDFSSPYQLAIPVSLLIVALIVEVLYVFKLKRYSKSLGIAGVTVGLAIVHAILVIRGGGDFMHGRLLLPSLFALQLPISCIALHGSSRYRGIVISIVTMMVIWASICIANGRVPYEGTYGPRGIADERDYYVMVTRVPNPITVHDYGAPGINKVEWASMAREASKKQLYYSAPVFPAGMRAFAAGPSRYMSTGGGLSSPIGSRISLDYRGRPGHEKWEPEEWTLARFNYPTGGLYTMDAVLMNPDYLNVETVLTKKVLDSPPVSDLLEAIHSPITASRFWSNILLAWKTQRMSIPKESSQAILKFCSPVSAETEYLLSLDPETRLLVLNGQSTSDRLSCEIDASDSGSNQPENLAFDLRPIPKPSDVAVHLLIEGQGSREYTLDYVLSGSENQSQEGNTAVYSAGTAVVLANDGTNSDTSYHFDRNLVEELQRVYGEDAQFSRLRKIQFESVSQYLEVREFTFYNRPVVEKFANLPLVDHLDVGNPWGEKEKYDYYIEGETTRGTQVFSYPNGVTLKDDWRAFKGYEQFTVRAIPGCSLWIVKRIDYGIGNQVVDVYVVSREGSKQYVGRWTTAGKDLNYRWRDIEFRIPAKYVDSEQLTVRFSYVSSDDDINSFFYWFYSEN